jgi:hypothetical protein
VVGAVELKEDRLPITSMFLKDDPAMIEECAVIVEVGKNEEAV